MHRVLTAMLLCAAAQAATLNVTMTINATVGLNASDTAFTVTGTAAFSGGITANGTFSATVPLTDLESGGSTVTVPYTITLPGGTLAGNLVVPTAILEGTVTSATGSGTITSASGTYAGDTGTFPTLSGTGGIGAGGITLSFSGAGTITTGGTVSNPPPTITAVLDAASNTPNLAQGTIFIVKGSNLCPSGVNIYSIPRPTVAPDGVEITFTPTGGGSGTNAYLWYEYNPSGTCQLAGILPSSVAVGSYNVTVTNGTVSAPASAQVVLHKFALFTQDSTGGGLASAQNVVSGAEYDLNRLTTGTFGGATASPAYPGEYMVAYGTGLGALLGGDNTASPAFDFSKTLTINAIVGGTAIPVLYAGRAGYAGEDQINFLLPTTIQTGCTVTFQISVNGTLSPATTLSIAATAPACTLPGYTTSQLAALDNGGTITSGGFSITQVSETVPTVGNETFGQVSGGFSQVTGFELASLSALPGYSFSQNTVGSCTVTTVTLNSTGQVTTAGGGVTNLDAGAVTLNGPSGSGLSNTAMLESGNLYSLTVGTIGGISLPGSVNGSIVGGTYTVAAAQGGTGIGPFNASIALGSPLALTAPLPTSVNRSQPLSLAWTGGNSTDPVEIVGYSGTVTGSGTSAVSTVTEFICATTAGTGGFTVSAQVLGQLQATPTTASGGTGFLEVASGPTPVKFNAPLVPSSAGTVASTLSALTAIAGSVVYQ